MTPHDHRIQISRGALAALCCAALLTLGCGAEGEGAGGMRGNEVDSSPVTPGDSAAPMMLAGSAGAPAPMTTTSAGSTAGSPAPAEAPLGDPLTQGEPTPAPAGDPLTPARCNGDAARTAMIGDSYIALSGDIPRFLQQYSGQLFRLHAVSGTQMVNGFPPTIPDQYRLALAQGEIESLVMDGGGNDVLLGDVTCRTTGPDGPAPGSPCAQTIERTVAGAAALLEEAADNGVREVVYFLYPHLPGINESLNPSLDYAYPLFREACENATVDCTLIDTRPAFEGHPEYIGIDGIHPTTPGSEVIAQLVWDAMLDNCEQGVAVQ